MTTDIERDVSTKFLKMIMDMKIQHEARAKENDELDSGPYIQTSTIKVVV